MARAKSTARAEARRRYRQATSQSTAEDAPELDYGERRPDVPATNGTTKTASRDASAPGRPGFMAAFRTAYHAPRILDDLRTLPSTLMSRGFLAALGLIVAAAVGVFLFPGYTGPQFAWQLLILPGSALAPQLVAGFFAPRASYLLGLIIGLIQGVVFLLFLTQFADRLQLDPLAPEAVTNLVTLAFLTGPIYGMLFASAAAWYRRFLALSSPRRAPTGRSSKPNPQKRAASRR